MLKELWTQRTTIQSKVDLFVSCGAKEIHLCVNLVLVTFSSRTWINLLTTRLCMIHSQPSETFFLAKSRFLLVTTCREVMDLSTSKLKKLHREPLRKSTVCC